MPRELVERVSELAAVTEQRRARWAWLVDHGIDPDVWKDVLPVLRRSAVAHALWDELLFPADIRRAVELHGAPPPGSWAEHVLDGGGRPRG
jgi:hypothetical protein